MEHDDWEEHVCQTCMVDGNHPTEDRECPTCGGNGTPPGPLEINLDTGDVRIGDTIFAGFAWGSD